MRRLMLGTALAILCFGAMSGCFYSVIAPSNAVAYYGPTTNTAAKVGEASATSILGIFITGDASIKAAMESGGITKVHHIDHQLKGFLGMLFATYTVKVYGE